VIDFDVGPGPPILLPLLQVEGVILVRLIRRTANQPVEHRWIVFDARTTLNNKNMLLAKELCNTFSAKVHKF
jgi:hypothetical protein